MQVAVKICGVRDPETVEVVREAGADWIGFVFFPLSPRFVPPARAASLARQAGGTIGCVGLFVEPSDEELAAVLGTVPLDAVQVYASEARATEIRSRFGLPVWRAVGIATRADLPAPSVGIDRLVLEAKPPPESDRPGGNAARFDWSLLADYHVPEPWLLAGGLTPENVAEAIRASGAKAVDVSSGVERARGVKDARLIRAFVAAARGGGGEGSPLPRSGRGRGAKRPG